MNVTDDRQTDRQTTDGRAIAYSEREREFTFAKNDINYTPKSQTSNLRNVHRVIMTVISPNNCPTPFNTRAR